jgi:putative inorganic carbon (HCO3(-)) transporter
MRRFAAWIDRTHWLWLALAAPLLVFPSPARSPALLAVPLLWLAAWIARPASPLPSTPLNLPVLAMAVMVLVSALATPDLSFSLTKVSNLVLGFGICFALAREARRPAGLRIGLAMLVALAVGVALVSLLGTNWGGKLGPLSAITSRLAPRLTGLPGAEEGFNPNQVAGALLWVGPVLVWLLFQPEMVFLSRRLGRAGRVVEKLGLLAATGLVLGTLALTQSRGGYLGAMAALVVGILFAIPNPVRRWAIVIVLAAAAVAATAVVAAGPEEVARRLLFESLGAAESSGAVAASSALNTLESRVEIWSRALYGIQDFPFTGMGMNMFRRVVPLLYPLFTISPDIDIVHAHNEFLQAALDLGVPGLVAFAAIYLAAAWMLGRTWAGADSGLLSPRLTRALAVGLGSGLAGHLVYGMFDAVALGARPGALFWILLGLVCGLYAQTRPAVSAPRADLRTPPGA